MSSEIIKVPDIGGSEDVEIIEIAVSEGDVIEAEDTLITLESDKASMDVPSPRGGKVVKVLVKEGDTVSEGDDIVELAVEGGDDAEPSAEQKAEQKAEPAPGKAPEPAAQKPAAKAGGGSKRTVEIKVPDLGGSSDEVEEEATLITLESDKASMDVPSPHAGKLLSLAVKEGDTVSEGDVIGTMEIGDGEAGEGSDDAEPAAAEPEAAAEPAEAQEAAASGEPERREIRVPDLSG
ncbi:biotin/lipoyl-containing protein, partial [Halomonas sp. BM-2019]|uniref:biotin/lipoyl-containing protein n=1 Tax=Halomonas sp. BM-2019 TaxID=2811227 RepID=UPI001B3C26F2